MPDKIVIESNVKNNSHNQAKKIFYADYVICTIPLGYLKKHSQRLYVPKLNVTKVR